MFHNNYDWLKLCYKSEFVQSSQNLVDICLTKFVKLSYNWPIGGITLFPNGITVYVCLWGFILKLGFVFKNGSLCPSGFAYLKLSAYICGIYLLLSLCMQFAVTWIITYSVCSQCNIDWVMNGYTVSPNGNNGFESAIAACAYIFQL